MESVLVLIVIDNEDDPQLEVDDDATDRITLYDFLVASIPRWKQ